MDESWEVVGKKDKNKMKSKPNEQSRVIIKQNVKKPAMKNIMSYPKPQDNTKSKPPLPSFQSNMNPFKPPKASKSIALFDLILTKKTSITNISNHANSSNEKTKRIDDLKPKTFIANKKKKKVISTIKKKILLERLNQYKSTVKAPTLQTRETDHFTILKIFNYFSPEEIEDPDEKSEILNNLRELLQPFGAIRTIELITSAPNKTEGVTIVHFETNESAKMAALSIQDLVLGGNSLNVVVCRDDDTSIELSSLPLSTMDQPPFSSSSSPLSASPDRQDNDTSLDDEVVVLYIENMINPDDVRDVEETSELLSDIQTLCNTHCSVGVKGLTSVWLEKRTLTNPLIRDTTRVLGMHSRRSYMNITGLTPNQVSSYENSGMPWLLIELSSFASAIYCINKMAGRVVNGVKLSLTLHDYSSYLGNDISETHLIDVLTMSQRRKSITLENDSQNSSPTRPIRRKSVSGSDSRRRKSIAGKSSPTHPALSPTAESHNEELHIDKKSVYGVVLREFVEKSQILDSDERDDILLEINRILIYNSPASTTTSSASQPLFPTKDNIEGSHDITFWQSFDISSVAVLSSDKTAIDEDNNLLDVLVTFPSLEACCVAMARLRGMVVAGTQITADVVSVPIKASHWNKSMPIGRQLPCLIIHRSEARGAVVVIKGYLPNSMSITDEVILSYKKEFLDAFMNQLLLDSSDKIDGFNNFDTCITRITSHMGRMDNNHSVPQTKDSAIVACVGFSAPQEALNVMLNLEGAIMGGQQVRLYISYASLIEELSGDIQDTDDQKFAVPAGDVRKRGSTGSLVAKLDLSRGSVSPLSVASTSGRSSAAGDITQRNRTVFRPDSEAIKLMALNRSPTPRRVESDDRSESSMEPDQITKKRTQKKRGGKFQSSSAAPSPLVTSSYLPSSAVVSSPASPESAISSGTVSVYKEAKQAPKLSKHSRAPANIPVASEEQNELIAMMLRSLAEFQTRAEQKDPIKAKQKLRYIVGMKQVTNGIKSGRAKLVLLTPDTEASQALDEKVSNIINEAISREIPVIYCLSRRKLGKSLGMSMKQSAAAIYDPSGVHDTFSKISNFIRAYQPPQELETIMPITDASENLQTSSPDTNIHTNIDKLSISQKSNPSMSQAAIQALLAEEDLLVTPPTSNLPPKAPKIGETLFSTDTLKETKIEGRHSMKDADSDSEDEVVEVIVPSKDNVSSSQKKLENSESLSSKKSPDSLKELFSAEEFLYNPNPLRLSRRRSTRSVLESSESFYKNASQDSAGHDQSFLSSSSFRSNKSSPRSAAVSRRASFFLGAPLLQNSTAVIDNGSYMMRTGFSSEDSPRSIFPSAVAVSSTEVNENEEKHAGYYVGQKALLNPGVRHPYENGVIESWEDMEAIWEHCFTDCLRVDTSTTRVFLTEAHMPSRVTRETTIETMFELFDVEATYLHVQPVLALFAAGLTSGCVIDSGEYSTTVYPVADGYHLVNASVRLSLGGCDISDILESLLLNSGRFSDEVQNILSNTVADIIRNIKEKHCYVNEFHQTEYSRASVKYTLPDGTVIDVGQDGALSQCTERFFNPLKFANICDSDEDSLPAAIIKSIMTAGLDLRRSLVNSIVLSGGNTMFRGLEGRLANELKSLMPGTMSSSLRILAPSDRSNSVWNGGSILTSLSTFEDQWITKADYDEIGSDIVHQKCSVYL